MPFNPINDDHAVVDCPFAPGFEHPFSADEMRAIHAAQGNRSAKVPAQMIGDFDPSDGLFRIAQGGVSLQN